MTHDVRLAQAAAYRTLIKVPEESVEKQRGAGCSRALWMLALANDVWCAGCGCWLWLLVACSLVWFLDVKSATVEKRTAMIAIAKVEAWGRGGEDVSLSSVCALWVRSEKCASQSSPHSLLHFAANPLEKANCTPSSSLCPLLKVPRYILPFQIIHFYLHHRPSYRPTSTSKRLLSLLYFFVASI